MTQDDEYAICAREDCDSSFLKATHNQKYCSPECCRVVTNERLIKQYHAKKKSLKSNSKRVCSRKNCETILSKYNKEDICELHKIERFKKRLQKWGWDISKLDI